MGLNHPHTCPIIDNAIKEAAIAIETTVEEVLEYRTELDYNQAQYVRRRV